MDSSGRCLREKLRIQRFGSTVDSCARQCPELNFTFLYVQVDVGIWTFSELLASVSHVRCLRVRSTGKWHFSRCPRLASGHYF